MIVMAGFVCDGKHFFDVVLRVSLHHARVVSAGYEGAKGLELVRATAPDFAKAVLGGTGASPALDDAAIWPLGCRDRRNVSAGSAFLVGVPL